MNIEQQYKSIPKESWQAISQKMELDVWKGHSGSEDRNIWWKENFGNYSSISKELINSIFEVGCGPYCKNIQLIMETLKNKPTRILLNDPLLEDYIKMNKPVAKFIIENRVSIYSNPLEECRLDDPVDMIIAINVMDHVYNLELCLESLNHNLKSSGILVFGNDLTNEKNFQETPKDDPNGMLHPIRFDYQDIWPFLRKFESLYEKISEPSRYHCGTLFFIGRK